MTPRFLSQPIGTPAWPLPGPGGLGVGLIDAFVTADGSVPRRDDLERPDVLMVTTGQQPGLFTGPAYTIHKALSARALAALLQERWGRPVIPVFWLAGDDHDFAEASHAAWPAADGTLREWRSPARPASAPLTPMYRERLGAEVDAAIGQFEADLDAAQFRASAVDWLRRHYRAGATVAEAYGGALAELLAPLDIACFDPTRLPARRAMASLLLRAAAAAVPLDRALAARSAELTAAGRDPEVAVGDEATLVMLEGRAGRDRLLARDGGYLTRRGGERISAAELQAIALAEPERLSPNVLLRPVVEAAILPTVAYVAGPGELRYLALTPPVYAALGVAPQLPVPRWSGIVVEPFVDRALEKFGATLEELVHNGSALEAKVARRHFPSESADALAAIRAALETGYGTLARGAGAIDPTLIRTMQGLQERSLFAVEQAERKLVRGLKRREAVELAQLTRARTAVRPGGQPQERILTAAVWVARYGPGFLAQLGAEIEGWYRTALEASPGGR